MSNERLAVLAQQGNKEAYEQLFLNVERFIRTKANHYASTSAKYEADDIFGIGCESFIQAVTDYDPSKGKFITLLGKYFFNLYCSRYYRKEKVSRNYESLKSLDEPAYVADNGEEFTFMGLLEATHDNTLLHIPSIVEAYEETLSTYSDRDKLIITYLITKGMKQKDVGEMFGLKQGNISRILVKFRNDLKQLLENRELL